jgi:hypothetical protein
MDIDRWDQETEKIVRLSFPGWENVGVPGGGEVFRL